MSKSRGTWMGIYSTLIGHEKTDALVDALAPLAPEGMPIEALEAMVVRGLAGLHWRALESSRGDGHVGDMSAERFVRVVGWPWGQSTDVRRAWLESGFVDDNATLHDFRTYNARLIGNRESKARMREAKKPKDAAEMPPRCIPDAAEMHPSGSEQNRTEQSRAEEESACARASRASSAPPADPPPPPGSDFDDGPTPEQTAFLRGWAAGSGVLVTRGNFPRKRWDDLFAQLSLAGVPPDRIEAITRDWLSSRHEGGSPPLRFFVEDLPGILAGGPVMRETAFERRQREKAEQRRRLLAAAEGGSNG